MESYLSGHVFTHMYTETLQTNARTHARTHTHTHTLYVCTLGRPLTCHPANTDTTTTQRCLTRICESLDNLSHCAAFLPDSHVYAVELLLLIISFVELLLVNYGVNSNGSFPRGEMKSAAGGRGYVCA